MVKEALESALATMEGNFSVILKDLRNRSVLFERDADRQLPSASTIKILIMVEAYRCCIEGRLDLDRKIDIKRSDNVDYSLISEMNTDQYTVRDLILLMMSISDNTATNVLIDLLGMESINGTIAALGLEGTSLQRKMMDFEAVKKGRQNLTIPSDMLKLVEKLYRNEILTPEACSEMLNIMSVAVGRDFMIRDLPEDVRCAHKTGELDGINHDVGIVYTDICDYALAIFATGLKDNVAGRNYIAELSKAIYDHISRF